MHALGKGLGQTVGQGLEQDAAVVVVVRLELRQLGLDADAGGEGEGADVILCAAFGRGDEVRQAEIALLALLLHLLANEV